MRKEKSLGHSKLKGGECSKQFSRKLKEHSTRFWLFLLLSFLFFCFPLCSSAFLFVFYLYLQHFLYLTMTLFSLYILGRRFPLEIVYKEADSPTSGKRQLVPHFHS